MSAAGSDADSLSTRLTSNYCLSALSRLFPLLKVASDVLFNSVRQAKQNHIEHTVTTLLNIVFLH